MSALHYMAKFNTPTAVWDLMFSKGADINIRDRGGRTPLDMAEAGGHTELVEYLLAKGAKRNSELPQIRPQAAPVSETAFDYTLIQQIGMMVLPLLVLVLVICWIRRIKK